MSLAQIAAEMGRESATLGRLLAKGGRRRVYRHHVFHRRATRLVAAAQRYLAVMPCARGGEGWAGLPGRLLRTHWRARAAAEAATDELAAARIDTAAQCLAIVAAASRVGCLAALAAVARLGAADCERRWGGRYVAAVRAVGCRRVVGRPQAKAKRRRDASARLDGYGNDDGEDDAEGRRKVESAPRKRARIDGGSTYGELLDALTPSR